MTSTASAGSRPKHGWRIPGPEEDPSPECSGVGVVVGRGWAASAVAVAAIGSIGVATTVGDASAVGAGVDVAKAAAGGVDVDAVVGEGKGVAVSARASARGLAPM